MVRPSQPASIDDLLSLVPKRQSMRLRNSRRPQFRIAHLDVYVSYTVSIIIYNRILTPQI